MNSGADIVKSYWNNLTTKLRDDQMFCTAFFLNIICLFILLFFLIRSLFKTTKRPVAEDKDSVDKAAVEEETSNHQPVLITQVVYQERIPVKFDFSTNFIKNNFILFRRIELLNTVEKLKILSDRIMYERERYLSEVHPPRQVLSLYCYTQTYSALKEALREAQILLQFADVGDLYYCTSVMSSAKQEIFLFDNLSTFKWINSNSIQFSLFY
jgi:hypothetical protein